MVRTFATGCLHDLASHCSGPCGEAGVADELQQQDAGDGVWGCQCVETSLLVPGSQKKQGLGFLL